MTIFKEQATFKKNELNKWNKKFQNKTPIVTIGVNPNQSLSTFIAASCAAL
ncbi:hypothetical protein HanPSC8_Chr15g0651991 [Helianthus annuus]|nr:hypothetical protein HanPSC8_Chr15g0651991 [Helianthus annuus]